MGKRVIITGATSMLGSALVRRCEAEGDEVYAVLRPESGQIANLAGTGAVRVSLALEDWKEHLTEKIREAAGNAPCDILYHFAWNGTYGDSRRDPAQQQKNVEYTKTAFQTAAELGCSTFVGAGSQAEFGPYDIPLSDALEKRPVTEYGNAGFISCENYSVSTKKYAEQRYGSLFGTESGSLLVIDMGMREFYIKNNGAVSEIITTAYSNTIADNIYKYASEGQYYKFASSCFSQELVLLRGGKISQPMRYISAALLALILGLLINYLILRFVTMPGKAGNHEIIDAAQVDFVLRNPQSRLTNTSKVYSPIRTSGGGGGSRGGGGGFSGGGGSGGGHRF